MEIDPEFLREGLITFILLVASIVFHEWGHALAADLLGDDTPRSEGRVTLSPVAHLDLMGTIVIPLLNIFLLGGGLPFIGWGKPVNINTSNLRNRWRDDILISMAGPAANLFLATLAIVMGSFAVMYQPRLGELVRPLVVMNVGLAVFNLIPLPPLDGGNILRRLLGMPEETYFAICRWSWLFLLLILNVGITSRLIVLAVEVACGPFLSLCRLINPAAFVRIFHR